MTANILHYIGNTPLLSVDRIWAKCEFLNPSGSIKARLAKYCIVRAEESGLLRPGDIIVEATSGNTGNALAMVAAVKGYSMLVLMPEGLSKERVAMSQAYGAEVRFVGRFHVAEALEEARRLGREPGYFCPQQFDTEWNIEENRTWLGPEILRQLPPDVRIDALVQGVGTGGTLLGVGQALRERHNPALKLFAMEPLESPTLAQGVVCAHQIEGIADGFVPSLYRRHESEVDEVVQVTSAEAVAAMKELARRHGIFAGPSSGANLVAARRIRAEYPEFTHVLTFFCDEGEKYLHEHFGDAYGPPARLQRLVGCC